MASVRNFDSLPVLGDLLRTAARGQAGLPGFSYLICLATEAHKAASRGWERIRDMPIFTIQGQPAELMAYGQAIPGLAIGDVRCAFFYSAGLLSLIEGEIQTRETKGGPVPVAAVIDLDETVAA